MSTFLQLAQSAQSECDIVGAQIAAVTNQTGELARLVRWMIQAWIEIQNRNNSEWRWMRSRYSLNTTLGADSYAGTSATDTIANATITRFKRWKPFDDRGASNVKIYLQSAGVATERWMSYLDWASFREIYKRGTVNNAPPAHYTLDPQNKLVFGPPPDGVYVVTGEYVKSAQVLAVETDVPECPADFHQVIVYATMRKYARFESAPDVMSGAVTEGNRLMRQLENDQLAPIATAGPLC